MKESLLGKIYSWGTSATYSDTTIGVWLAGLALVLILAFLWSTVVRDVLSDVAQAA
jgi:hypothetical protein